MFVWSAHAPRYNLQWIYCGIHLNRCVWVCFFRQKHTHTHRKTFSLLNDIFFVRWTKKKHFFIYELEMQIWSKIIRLTIRSPRGVYVYTYTSRHARPNEKRKHFMFAANARSLKCMCVCVIWIANFWFIFCFSF